MKGYEITADMLNIRSGPGIQYDIIGSEPKGIVVGEAKILDWLPIELEDNTIGWVSKKYLKEIDLEDDEEVDIPILVTTGSAIVTKAMTQNKDPYIYGHEVDLNDPNPKAFDCSELVEWVCTQLKVVPKVPDGAIYQYKHCEKYGTLITIAEGVKTPGALLFRLTGTGNHVVISRGDGSTIEAKGTDYGVGVFSITGRGFNAAAKIPGVIYG